MQGRWSNYLGAPDFEIAKGIFFLSSKIYRDQRRLKGVKKKNKLTQFVLNFEKSFPVAMVNWIRKY